MLLVSDFNPQRLYPKPSTGGLMFYSSLSIKDRRGYQSLSTKRLAETRTHKKCSVPLTNPQDKNVLHNTLSAAAHTIVYTAALPLPSIHTISLPTKRLAGCAGTAGWRHTPPVRKNFKWQMHFWQVNHSLRRMYAVVHTACCVFPFCHPSHVPGKTLTPSLTKRQEGEIGGKEGS